MAELVQLGLQLQKHHSFVTANDQPFPGGHLFPMQGRLAFSWGKSYCCGRKDK